MTMKWAKVIDENTKTCEVGLGNNYEYYRKHGYRYVDVECASNGMWYLKGYAPLIRIPTNAELEIEKLKKELQSYDYIGNKIATGCATIEEYADKISYCEELRKKIRRLMGEIVQDEEGAV